jgi:hypothetical protein
MQAAADDAGLPDASLVNTLRRYLIDSEPWVFVMSGPAFAQQEGMKLFYKWFLKAVAGHHGTFDERKALLETVMEALFRLAVYVPPSYSLTHLRYVPPSYFLTLA